MSSSRRNLLLEALARINPRAYFIQIGANEDPARNPLPDVIHRYEWRGVIVDPIPVVAQSLRRAYGQLDRLSVEQAAVAPSDGERRFYYDGSASDTGKTAPTTPSVTGALRREILFLAPNFKDDLDEHVIEIVTPCVTFESLCRRHQIESFDILRIDTAGDEADILSQVDFDRFRPTVVIYSHFLLGAGVRRSCVQRLERFGYDSVEDGKDTWCFSTAALTTRQAVALRSIWGWTRALEVRDHWPTAAGFARAARRVLHIGRPAREIAFPLSDPDRRYLMNGYDDRMPLPSGAATYLRQDNPRLTELRRKYGALDLPAVRHHMWSQGRVAQNVNLRYFRGDNLYQWHYPEHPRAMALKLFVYMKYLESHGGKQLLQCLSEDGRFGCWAAEVSDYGKVSRDLLDSVNEILFLDRHLRVLSQSSIRVLDIGAGYGRLAHRMAAAVPGLADYCCVDAVPESTFLAEYYLGFRGCFPPAHALPLDQVPALQPGDFDLAVNVHSFSECTIAAITWWVHELVRLRVPHLFVVPNEADGILSREADGSYHSVLPVLEAAGYVPTVKERAIQDRATRAMLMLNDNFYLFSLSQP